MPPLLCPRCQRPNPEIAHFCHFDGIELRSGQASSGVGRLLQEFVFPSGKRCRTFDELAQACQDDWAVARELLRKGTFVKYFSSLGRMDLARSAEEGMEQANVDMGLSNLVNSLPVSRTQGPRLDLHPRRLMLGTVFAGETRQVPLVVSNQGQGMLQGTLTVAEGGEWLRIHGVKNGQCGIQTPREQQILLQVDTRGLAAGQAYGAKLTVVTNGGVVELPAKLDLTAHPFERAPFQGVRTQRELAERMRSQPKAAVPLLESGEVGRWFEANGWNYPVRGTPAKGVAGVQQFFESLGLSRPPAVKLSQTEASHVCKFPETAHGQVTLTTPAKKWVYGNVESDADWLTVLTPSVSGPKEAQIGYEIDPRQIVPAGNAEGNLIVYGNGGQKLTLHIRVQVTGQKAALGRRLLQPVITCTLAFFLIRLMLVPVVDIYGRSAAADAALARVPPGIGMKDPPHLGLGEWLNLPWWQNYTNPKPEALDDLIGKASPAQQMRTHNFRDYYTSYLLRVVIGFTWWLGPLAGVFVMWRRGNVMDAPWGLLAGAAAGLAISATVGIAVIVGDLGPHLLWDLALRTVGGGVVMLGVWCILALMWWTCLGLALGTVLTLLGPLGRPFAYPFQVVLSGLFQVIGVRSLANYFAPL